ncbi:MAG: TniB family NTP-binding protein [Paraglaciecola sp.]|nr:TniB family NTP-binding protein [Paraglaciecola sp.]
MNTLQHTNEAPCEFETNSETFTNENQTMSGVSEMNTNQLQTTSETLTLTLTSENETMSEKNEMLLSQQQTVIFPPLNQKVMAEIILMNDQFKQASNKFMEMMALSGQKVPLAMLVVGDAGTGKSTFATKIHEQCNQRSQSRGSYMTVPCIMVQSPKQSTESKLIEQLLIALGDISPKHNKGDSAKERLYSLIARLGVELIIIDEIHDFLPKTRKGSITTGMLFIKELMSKTNIPILMLGTPHAKVIYELSAEFATRIRFNFEMTRIPFGMNDDDKFDFAELASAYAECFPRELKSFRFVSFEDDTPVYSNLNLLDKIYVATAGLPRGLRDFFLRIHLKMTLDANYSPNLANLEEIYDNVAALNNNIDFNPFKVTNAKIQDYLHTQFIKGGSRV